jgi:hypothetical protein
MAAVALSLASCGGGGGGDDAGPSSTAAGPPPAPREAQPRPQVSRQIGKARLIERADAICKRDVARLSARLAAVPKPSQPVGAERLAIPYLELNEAAIRSGTERIDALGKPSSDGDLLEDYLAERTTAANALRAAVAAAKQGDTRALDAALATFARNEARPAAAKFGFKVCDVGAGRLAK